MQSHEVQAPRPVGLRAKRVETGAEALVDGEAGDVGGSACEGCGGEGFFGEMADEEDGG